MRLLHTFAASVYLLVLVVAADVPPATAPATDQAPATRPTLSKPISTDINPAEHVSYRTTNREIQALLFTPKLRGKTPAVIYVHDIFGLTDFNRQQAEDLARQGYTVLLPNLYSRVPNSEKGFDAQGARAAYERTPDAQVMDDLVAGIDFLNAEGKPTAEQPLGVVGLDMGGIYAMKLAAADLRVSAAVNYYGRILYTNVSRERPVSPVEDLFNLRAPLLSFYGEIDPQIPADHLRALESRLANNPNKTYYEVQRFPNVGHGFLVPTRQGYNAEAAKKAAEQTRDFLARFLRPEPKKLEV